MKNQNTSSFNDFISFRKFISLSFIPVLFVLGIIMNSCNQNKAPEFDHYGVYLKTDNGFVELKKNLQTNLPKVEIEDELAIYVFSPQAKEMQYNLYEGQFDMNRGITTWESPLPIEQNTAPVGNHPEMIEINANANDVFGGRIRLIVKNNGNYYFEATNVNIQSSLINWMEKNIALYKNGDYTDLIKNLNNDFILDTYKNNEVTPQEFVEQSGIGEYVSSLSAQIENIKSNKDLAIDFNKKIINLGDQIYSYNGNGKWKLY
jgi:hypothetical protein